jgi:dihydrodipicolinate synthase/N-acetylneuraminate lyase
MPLNSKLFVEANPIPVKWALAQMGKIKGGIRLPLTTLSTGNQAQVLAAMKDSGVI